MNLYLVCLVLPAVAFADMGVHVTGTHPNLKASVLGSNIEIITDNDMTSFSLSDNSLKRGAEAYFGKWPTDVYVRSPTPWGDLYRQHTDLYKQVQMTLKPISATILQVSSVPEIVKNDDFYNNSTKKTTVNAGITQEVQKSFSTTWSQSTALTVGEEIGFEFDIEVAKASGKVSFSYTCTYGKDTTKSETVTVGASSGVSVELEPHESVHAELQADRGTMQIQVVYEATLSGSVVANYEDTYKGHHFWGLDINEVMKGAGLTRKITASQIVNVGFYTNSRIIISDHPTGKILKTHMIKM